MKNDTPAKQNIKYYPRVVDSQLQRLLRIAGAANIRGPKWCGKSTTALQQANSVVYMQNQDNAQQNIELAKNAPSILLEGPTPRLIDEWQVVPHLWDQVRFEIDKRQKNGQFILTGSATPLKQEVVNGQIKNPYEHSGIGRIAPLHMRTMSLYESRESTGLISLSTLLSSAQTYADSFGAKSDLTLADYAYLTCRGGWPRALTLSKEDALEEAKLFFDALIAQDINTLFRRERNTESLRQFIRAYARAIGTQTSLSQLQKDMEAYDGMRLSPDTIAAYIAAFEHLFIIENAPAWNTNLRSKTAIRTTPTRYFVDPSIATVALGASPASLLQDLELFGFLFEALCVRDLRIYVEKEGGALYHYRDKRNLEVDAIVTTPKGNWCAIEIKLASQEGIDEGAAHLLKFKNDLNLKYVKPPEALVVLTAGSVAYRRPDGVLVCPLGCLGP